MAEVSIETSEKVITMIDQPALSDDALNTEQAKLSENKQHKESNQGETSDKLDQGLKENDDINDALNTEQTKSVDTMESDEKINTERPEEMDEDLKADASNREDLELVQLPSVCSVSDNGARPKQGPGMISDPSFSARRELHPDSGSGAPSMQASGVSSDPLFWVNKKLLVHMLVSSRGVFSSSPSLTDMTIATDGNISVNGPDHSFEIARVNVRWANKCLLTDIHGQGGENTLSCIALSYVVAGEIALIAFNPQIGCEDFLLLMAEMIRMNYTAGSVSFSEVQTSRAFEMAQSLPIYAGFVYSEVRSNGDGTVTEGPMFVTIDVEAICIYRELNEKRMDQLMFWSESSPESVNIIKYNQDKNTFNFQSQKANVLLPFKQDNMQVVRAIRDHLHVLKPQRQGILTNIPLMAELRSMRLSEPSRPTHHPNVKEVDATNSFEGPSDPWSYSSNVVSTIMDEAMRAEQQMEGNIELQLGWITIESDLKELAEGGLVPQTDYDSGGLSPDNEDHLKKALDDVAEHMKNLRLPEALSRLRGCVKLFKESSNAAIRQFMSKDELVLMKMIYYRSLLF